MSKQYIIDNNEDYTNPFDTSNAIVLTSKKKKQSDEKGKRKKQKLDSRGRVAQPEKQKVLSKKRRKRLEKVLESKKKKANRADLLESLSRYQADDNVLQQLSSIAKMQTKVLHKSVTEMPLKLNSIAGSKRKRKLQPEKTSTLNSNSGPYFETDSSSDSGDELLSCEPKLKTETNDVTWMQPTPVEQSEATETVQESLPILEESKATKTEPSPCAVIDTKPSVHVPVYRTNEVQKSRMELPIFAEEQVIVEAINENQVVIICGETGSGKTTQVPQFLFEAGYAENNRLIGITEPRRVAAVSMSKRIGFEMNLSKDIVSYQIRYEGNATEETKIKFMTDGVLMKEMQKDILLSRYSVIIIDEAHERSMYSDILIGLLSRIVPLRERKGDPLKLIVMSATLRVEDFTAKHLFRSEPIVLKVDSRQYPVTVYFNRRTPENYLLEAYKKACKIHRLLPDGAILIFVSGQQEVRTLIRWLKKTFPWNKFADEAEKSDISETDIKRKEKRRKRKNLEHVPKVDLDSYTVKDTSSDVKLAEKPDLNEMGVGSDLGVFDDFDNFPDDFEELYEPSGKQPLFCLPLYSLLPTVKQSKVFEPPPLGCRLCVVATNVAETSITIPDVKYVVDTCKEKTRLRDPVTGVSKFEVNWTSKASADQRAGRAGRVGPGHCYRLCSSAVFNDDFIKFSQPEIMNKPVDELVLQMKTMNIIKVNNFPFPTTPDVDALFAAEDRLIRLGTLDRSADGLARVTQLGNTASLFPVTPQFAKILALANQHDLLSFAVCLVAALSVREPFSVTSNVADEERLLNWLSLRRSWCAKGQSRLLGDLMVLLKAVGAVEFEGTNQQSCEKLGLRFKAVVEIRKLRRQLTNLVNATCRLDKPLVLDSKMSPPTEVQVKLLRQIVLAGLAENLAVKMDILSDGQSVKGAYTTQNLKDDVFIHPMSILFKEQPDFVIYQEVIDTSNKKYMTCLCAIEPEWLPVFAENYCNFGQLIKEHTAFYDGQKDCIVRPVICTFGKSAWPLPPALCPHPIDTDFYRHFAVALLEGKVFPKLQDFRSKLVASPNTMLKTWSKIQPRTEKLLNALISKDAKSRSGLCKIWETNADYLYEEYCLWLDDSVHDNLLLAWPPVDQ